MTKAVVKVSSCAAVSRESIRGSGFTVMTTNLKVILSVGLCVV